MAQHKRKRNSTRPKPNKRPKYRDSSGSEPIDDILWEAERILAEAVVRGVKKYHIKWKGIDPNTGKEWSSTWEPEGNANELLVTAWEAEKARRLEQERKEREEQRQEVEAARRIRNLRVIESSPESDTRSSSTVTPPEPAHDEAGPEHQSSTATTPVADRAPPVRPSPVIQIRRRGSSLEREEFEAFSQLLSSQATSVPIASVQVHSQDSNLDSSQLFAARPRPYSSGIVPDSQSSTGEATFIPITQQTEDTNQQNTGSSTLTEEEELVDDSCLGEIVQGAAPDVVSPARSIPETIPDTTVADTESQHQGDLGAFELAPNLSHPEDTTIEDHVEAIAESEPHTDISPCTDSNTSAGRERVEQDQEQVLPTQTAETAQTNPLVFVDIEEIPISPGKPSTTLGDSQILTADVRDADRDVPQVVAGIFGEEAHPPQEAGVRDSQPSLAEHWISEDKQFLFYSQHHIRDFQQQAPSSRPAFAQEDRNGSSQHSADTSAALTTQAEQALTGPATQSKAVSHSAYDPQRQSTSLPVQSKAQEHSLSKSLAISNLLNPLPQEPSCSPEVHEQNAQIVSLEAVLSTQEESPHSIRSTIEKEYSKKRQNSESRHDSSQETPERSSGSSNHSSSPLPYPPSQSLITQASKPPPRPRSPLFSSSPFIMSNESTAELIKRQMEEALAKQKAENPYIPKRRNNRGSTTPSSSAPEGSTASQANRLLRTAEQEGTRSPSVVPDRSPAVQVPTSLRTVAYAPTVPQTTPPDDTKMSPSDAPSKPAEAEVAAPTESAAPDVPPSAGSDQMDVSDADDEDNNEDNESLLNDDLQLAWSEFIVPLYIQGRQSDVYSQCIASKKEILDQFLDDPSSVEPVSQVEEVLSYLRAVETHIDLVFAEAGTSFSNNEMSSTQTEHAAQFGMENSTKFRFLHELFNFLRDTDTHVVITTEKADEALFKILETFCRANKVHFDMPTRGVQGSLEEATGKMNVSIIPQNGSPIMRFSDLIICLDGVQDATEIRKKLWAQSTEREYVPIIHLVIPRTVGHIERYVSPNLDPVERMHTILASLAHMRADIGRPIFEDTPRDTACAALICEWLQNSAEDEDYEWPIPSIGSIKDVIEYQTQMSQPLANSPIPERAKRPLVQEELDPAKRMRYTPQPQPVQSSTVNQNNEVTRISDSMPGTSAVESDLRKQLTRMEEMYYAERAARKAEEKRFREHEEMWDKQQTVHENLMNEYRVLSQKQKAAETKLETLTKTNTILTERLQARTAEVRELEKQLAEQRATHLLSADAQIVEITKLRTELAAAQQEKDKAVKGAATSDDLLEYTRNAYQDAQNIAATSNARIAELEAQGLKLTQAASDQASKLKGLHLDRNYELQEKHIRTLKAELNIVKKALQNKDEEVTRLKSLGRQGVGTRGTSATPQPKIRSRAGSPSLLGGRLANLRNG